LNRLQTVYDHGNQQPPDQHHYAYNEVGSLAELLYANGVRHVYEYDELNRLTRLEIQNPTLALENAFEYQLNDVGHRTRITEATGRVRNFTYDNLNRLTREAVTGDPEGVNGTVDYTYDLVGNRLDRISSLPGIDTDVQLHDLNDRLQSDDVDDNGNTLVATGFTTGDVYDPWDRLIRRVKPTGEIVDLMYDTAGNRVAKTVHAGGIETTTAYLVDSNSLTGYSQVLEELRSNGAGGLEVFRTYAVGHTQLTQSQRLPDGNGGEHWVTHSYLLDGQNSVWGLADSQGTVTDRYAYEAYGTLLAETGQGTPNLYRYTGEQWDPDLEHYYLRARYYETDRGRFWTMDPFEGFRRDPQSLHKYLYAHANPVMYTDPSGNMSLSELSLTISIKTYVYGTYYGAYAVKAAGIAMTVFTLVDFLQAPDKKAWLGETYQEIQEGAAMAQSISPALGPGGGAGRMGYERSRSSLRRALERSKNIPSLKSLRVRVINVLARLRGNSIAPNTGVERVRHYTDRKHLLKPDEHILNGIKPDQAIDANRHNAVDAVRGPFPDIPPKVGQAFNDGSYVEFDLPANSQSIPDMPEGVRIPTGGKPLDLMPLNPTYKPKPWWKF
ncbi:MAG: hypothetical protein PF795_05510, partial [Kiritimatiellae bacterium]|nr:hypothetical protein [Kiritimatiellia bacterium]